MLTPVMTIVVGEPTRERWRVAPVTDELASDSATDSGHPSQDRVPGRGPGDGDHPEEQRNPSVNALVVTASDEGRERA
jgi:hypothetical protein